MKGHGEKFSRRMEVAIVALLEQPTIPEAAKAAGVSYTSLWRWLKDPAFQAEYRQARRHALGQATAQLQQAAGAAVMALREIIEDRDASTSARVAAAKAVLELGLRAVEVEDLDARITALEQAVQGRTGATPIRNAR